MLKYFLPIRYLIINELNNTILDLFILSIIFIFAFTYFSTKFAVIPFLSPLIWEFISFNQFKKITCFSRKISSNPDNKLFFIINLDSVCRLFKHYWPSNEKDYSPIEKDIYFPCLKLRIHSFHHKHHFVGGLLVKSESKFFVIYQINDSTNQA